MTDAGRRNGNRLKSTHKKRATKRSAGEWKPVFLTALRNSANVRAACQAAGIDRKTAYNHRDKDEEFRKQWNEALEDACDILEAEAWQRARSKSDLLLIFLLKAHRPHKYRETTRHELANANNQPITIEDAESARRKILTGVSQFFPSPLTNGEVDASAGS